MVGRVLVVLILLLTFTVVPAHADESRYTAFYTPPSPLPVGAPGDLIRTEPSDIRLEPSGQLGHYEATATRIMYLSADTNGQPIAVTGTYLEPDNPWPGPGPRPLLSYAVGTIGMGEQCAPSRLFSEGIHFSSGLDIAVNIEEGMFATLVARGFAVVVTDYQGLGTIPGHETYMNRLAQGHAVLDAARAAMHLPGTSLSPTGPVGISGYSQGGAAAASAAELASSYAPGLHVVGTYAGAPPADIPALIPVIDGSSIAGLFGYILNGIINAYPETESAIRSMLNDWGNDMLDTTRNQCADQTVLEYAFHPLQEYFDIPVDQVAADPTLTGIVNQQRIGALRPNAPVFIDQGRNDELVPWDVGAQLGRDWCAQGADVELWTNHAPPFMQKWGVNHSLTQFVDGERAMAWFADRFTGAPTTPNCGSY
jgi:Secretory lipase